MQEISSNGASDNSNNNISKVAQQLVQKYWSCEDNDDIGDISCHVRGIPVKIIDNASDCQVWINKLLSNKPRLLGLDCEWKTWKNNNSKNKYCQHRGPVALLQICDDNICLLLKMINIKQSGNFPSNLVQLLENADIIKVGLTIAGDKQKLFKDYDIDVNGCVDIKKFMLKKCLFVEMLTNKEKMNVKNSNLEGICNFMLGYKALSKDKNITMSNWELNPLSQSQIIYGASDAIYGYYTFLQCILNVNNLKIDYSSVSQNENEKIIDNVDLVKLCDGVVQVNYTKQMQQVQQVCFAICVLFVCFFCETNDCIVFILYSK